MRTKQVTTAEEFKKQIREIRESNDKTIYYQVPGIAYYEMGLRKKSLFNKNKLAHFLDDCKKMTLRKWARFGEPENNEKEE